ncbi:MAG: 50S ribosomal protein L18 [Pseudomonadota bacterium]
MNKRQFRNRLSRKKRIRGIISGTTERPRMTVYRSNKHLYVQVIDDASKTTLASVSTLTKGIKEITEGKCNIKVAATIGEEISKKLKEKGIETVSFDRNGYLYHGKIKALADAARKAGIKI